MNTKRPVPVTVAVVLLALLSVLNFMSPLLPTDYPTIVLFLGGALGVVGLLAAADLWLYSPSHTPRANSSRGLRP